MPRNLQTLVALFFKQRLPHNTPYIPLAMAPADDTPGATPPHKRRRMRDAQSPSDRSPNASRRGPDRGDSSDYYSKARDSSRSPAGRRRRAVSASSSGSSTRSESPSPRRPARRRSPASTSSDRTRTESFSPKPVPTTPQEPQPQPTTPPSPRRGPLRPNYKARLALHGHGKPVSQARISPDGRFIASASADATVKIWDAATGAHLDTLVGHMAGVSCVAWAPDSNTLASGSDDKAIRLWDRVTGRPKSTARKSLAGGGGGADMAPLRGHHNYVHCLAFSPKGNIIASGSYDEAVFLWDVRAGRLMRSLPAHSDPVSGIDFSPDGTLVASCSTDAFVVQSHMGLGNRPVPTNARARGQPGGGQRVLLAQRPVRARLQPGQLHPAVGLRGGQRQEDVPGAQERKVCGGRVLWRAGRVPVRRVGQRGRRHRALGRHQQERAAAGAGPQGGRLLLGRRPRRHHGERGARPHDTGLSSRRSTRQGRRGDEGHAAQRYYAQCAASEWRRVVGGASYQARRHQDGHVTSL
ncbi:will die slowly protein [Cordyceps javanica]|uniref:Will die slowly protein n=1 Tax=Cordyceps javanica TaxID=43265 RepID=A0A545VDA6_9HYPO|nr:will die slowly protein [Cordyceps javanica]